MPPRYFENGHFRSYLAAAGGNAGSSGASVQLLLALTAAAFVSVYWMPVRLKRPLIVIWFLVSALLLLGLEPVAGLLAAHMAIYLVFHPRGPRAGWIAGAAGAVATLLVVFDSGSAWTGFVFDLAAGAGVGMATSWLYVHWLQGVLLLPRPGRAIRRVVTHLPVVVLLAGTFGGSVVGTPWIAPIGLILLFWHYMRLLMYGIDVEDGLVPERLPLSIYLSVFLSPAMLNSWPMLVDIAQGYSYQTDRFLSREKNEVVLRGLGLIGIGVAYMALGPFVIVSLIDIAGHFGVTAYYGIPALLDAHLVARDAAPSTILVSGLLEHLKWIFMLGAVLHWKIGLWRLFGYDVDPYLRFPLLATNLVTLWGRLTYHWKEVLVRGFYYPVFLRLSGWPFWARSLAATLAAAGLANWLWAHTTEMLIGEGMTTTTLERALHVWPYFLLLAGGIGIAQVWVTWSGRRRAAWTFDRWLVTDILAAYGTAQFYGVIHIFYYIPYSNAGTPADYWFMFFRAFGLV